MGGRENTNHALAQERNHSEELENEIRSLEDRLTNGADNNNSEDNSRLLSLRWESSRAALGNFLDEKAKGAFIRPRTKTIKDIDRQCNVIASPGNPPRRRNVGYSTATQLSRDTWASF